MEWISVEENIFPQSVWHVVFVTDRKLTCLARYIEDPKSWYGKDLMIWDEQLRDEFHLDKEWHEPHWLFIKEVGPFIKNDEYFGNMDEITHWMPLPEAPKELLGSN